MKKTTLTLLLCAALVLSACNTTPSNDDSATESTVNINDAINNPDSITDSEISELIDAYLAFEFLTERASDSMSVDYDQSYTDGLYYYHKVTDERYDTWEEWAAYVGSIFTGKYLTEILSEKVVFINVDGYTYWQSGAMGWYIEDGYTYEASDVSADRMTLRIIRTLSVPEEEENIITTNFELCMTDDGWRICGLAAPKDTFEANTVENIIFHSDRGGWAEALEGFYSDDKYDYYFPTIRSDVVIVYYKDGTQQTVKEAFAEGKITIADLDRFNIGYYREPRQDYDPSRLLTAAEVRIEEPLGTEYYEYIHDQNEYTRYLLISTSDKITDVRVTDIILDTGMEFGDDLYTLPTLDSKKPLLLGVVFYGDLTSYGIVFKDSDGITHRFIISESGKDGSFVVQEYNFFGGE